MAKHDLAASWRSAAAAAAAAAGKANEVQRQPTSSLPLPAATASSSSGFSPAEALAAHEAKSFDYRMLHLLLQRLAGLPYDEALLAFMAVDERLVRIGKAQPTSFGQRCLARALSRAMAWAVTSRPQWCGATERIALGNPPITTAPPLSRC
jgi:hypothetical protein